MPDMDAQGLLTEFGDELILASRPPKRTASAETLRAVAHKSATRHHLRRAKAEATLASILPPLIAPGDSWHVISHGDIDALSYLRHAITGAGYFDTVLLSTWCMAMPDITEIRAFIDAGKIDAFSLYVGEIFPNQYGDEFAAAKQLADDFGSRICVARNHSKVILAANHSLGLYLAMEGSANVNTNPRIEQTTLTNDRALHDFYADFFAGLKTIVRQGDAGAAGARAGRLAPVGERADQARPADH